MSQTVKHSKHARRVFLKRYGVTYEQFVMLAETQPMLAYQIRVNGNRPVEQHINPNHPRQYRRKYGLSNRQFRMVYSVHSFYQRVVNQGAA